MTADFDALADIDPAVRDALYFAVIGVPYGTTTFDVRDALLGGACDADTNDDGELLDTLDPETAYLAQERASRLRTELDGLEGHPRCVLGRLYEVDDEEPLSHVQIANILGVPEERVRRIEAGALAALRILLADYMVDRDLVAEDFCEVA